MAACEQCGQALTVELDSDSFDEATSSSVGRPQTAPDDLQLACGCHFHWYVQSQTIFGPCSRIETPFSYHLDVKVQIDFGMATSRVTCLNDVLRVKEISPGLFTLL